MGPFRHLMDRLPFVQAQTKGVRLADALFDDQGIRALFRMWNSSVTEVPIYTGSHRARKGVRPAPLNGTGRANDG